MNSISNPSSWWSTFFTGLMTDVQVKMNNPAQTLGEAEFIKATLELPRGAAIADIPSGDGRLSIALAREGYRVYGVDISADIIRVAKEAATRSEVDVDFRVQDMKSLTWSSELDGAFCFGNSFAYFDDADNALFLRGIFRALKTGGRFILQTNLIAESILTRPLTRSWYNFADILFLHSPVYDPPTARLTSEYTLVRGDLRETKKAHYRIYTLKELMVMLQSAGFRELKMFGGLGHEPFKLGDPALYVLATK